MEKKTWSATAVRSAKKCPRRISKQLQKYEDFQTVASSEEMKQFLKVLVRGFRAMSSKSEDEVFLDAFLSNILSGSLEGREFMALLSTLSEILSGHKEDAAQDEKELAYWKRLHELDLDAAIRELKRELGLKFDAQTHIQTRKLGNYWDNKNLCHKLSVANSRNYENCILERLAMRGCQGALLESVIRRVCVKELNLRADRKDHSVLVSTLKSRLKEEGIDYRHLWRIHPISHYDQQAIYALDLLEGEGSYLKSNQKTRQMSTSSLTASSSKEKSGKTKRKQGKKGSKGKLDSTSSSGSPGLDCKEDFPTLFYTSIEDVGFWDYVGGKLSSSKKMRFKLHLECHHKDGPHKVENQPGRTVELPWRAGSFDISIPGVAVGFVNIFLTYTGLKSTTGVSVDSTKADQLWAVPKLFNVDMETLLRRRSGTSGKISPQDILNMLDDCWGTSEKIPQRDILKMLEDQWKLDPSNKELQDILKQKKDSFWIDFRLKEVEYIEGLDKGRRSWLCDKCLELGLKSVILKSKSS